MKTLMRIMLVLYVGILMLATYTYKWGRELFSGVSFDTIIFQLSVPLKGAGSDIMDSFKAEALLPSIKGLLFFLMIFVVYLWISSYLIYADLNIGRTKKEIRIRLAIPIVFILVVLILWSEVLWVYIDRAFGLNDYIKSQVQQSNLIETEYVNPDSVEIVFPKQKRNLIWIIMESAETSSQSEYEGGIQVVNYTPEMTKIAKENVSFSQSELIEGAAVTPGSTFTIAAMVSQMAGIPFKTPIGDNSMNEYDLFMPHLMTMGDILETEGYHNVFMCGSDLDFAGRDNFLSQHGKYEEFDYKTAIEQGYLDESYHVWWGYEDAKLYQFAQDKLINLSEGDEPFNLTLLTVDTHHQGGYKCALCANKYESNYGNVWSCASKQVWEFINWAKQQDFYRNTTIVITGDHLSMDTTFYDGIDTFSLDGTGTQRKVYNAFINSATYPLMEKNRRFTTLDFFPTILASIGVSIEGDRLGLGTNLFSSKETLSEQMGYDMLFKELKKQSLYYNKELLY